MGVALPALLDRLLGIATIVPCKHGIGVALMS